MCSVHVSVIYVVSGAARPLPRRAAVMPDETDTSDVAGVVKVDPRAISVGSFVCITNLQRAELNWRLARVVSLDTGAASRVGLRLLADEPDGRVYGVRRLNILVICPDDDDVATQIANLIESGTPNADGRLLIQALGWDVAPAATAPAAGAPQPTAAT